MALSIINMRRISATDPPRCLIYGPPGLGKTTLASEWPEPVFLQVEDGTPAGLELSSFGKIDSYDQLLDTIAVLYNEEHDRKTVVIDSLDKLEPMVWAKCCADNGWQTIEAPGYGKGYVMADNLWRDLIEGLNALRRDRGMNVVYIAHSSIVQVDDPMTASYSRFDIRLHKRAIGILQDEVDAILFLNQDVMVKADNSKKDARVRADGGGNRWLFASPRPAFVAKNRYGIPDKMLYDRGKGFAALAKYFPVPEGVSLQETLDDKPAKKTKATNKGTNEHGSASL